MLMNQLTLIVQSEMVDLLSEPNSSDQYGLTPRDRERIDTSAIFSGELIEDIQTMNTDCVENWNSALGQHSYYFALISNRG